MRKCLSTIAGLAVAALAAPASAGEIWFDSQHAPFFSGEYSSSTSLVFSGSGVNVRVSAWTIANSGTDIDRSKLGVWSPGIGVRSTTDGNSDDSHSTDNYRTKDFLLLQFDQVVDLDQAVFNTGWWNDGHSYYYNDADATIGYATTALSFAAPPSLNGNPTTAFTGLGLSTYASNGGGGTRNINTLNHTGNLWLIGASFSNPDTSKDGFKLEKLTFTVPPPGVPEPSTWLMMILGFGMVGGAIRAQRRQKLTVSYA